MTNLCEQCGLRLVDCVCAVNGHIARDSDVRDPGTTALHQTTGQGTPETPHGDNPAPNELTDLRYQVGSLRYQVENLKQQVRHMQVVAERKNRELDALHMVWCDGGCNRGVHRWTDDEVSEEMVVFIERYAQRLRRWYQNHEYRRERGTV